MEQYTAVQNVNRQLRGFTGTENWYRHTFTGKLFTDGVHHLRHSFQCYWLVDDILYFTKQIREPFQVWTLRRVMVIENNQVKDRSNKFELTCDDGDGNTLFSHQYNFSDFEGDIVQLYFGDGVLLLPSEY